MQSSLASVPVWIAGVLVAASACAPDTDQPVETAVPAAVAYHTSELTGGLGLPFSESASVGNLLFLSGMIGTAPGTLGLVPGGLEPEARQTLANIRTMLEAAGASIRDVVKCTVMLDDMSQWPAFNQIYVDFFGDHRPARSAFGADGLALGATVEVECIAVIPDRSS
jgi:reactive intermediate/imine deaminase